MKIAFDENVPAPMVRVFSALASEKGFQRKVGAFEIVSAKDYAPNTNDLDYLRKNDVPWLQRFSADGGKAVITGDVEMRYVPHERLALQQLGFVVVFFERNWGQWNFFSKSALLLKWWPKVAVKLQKSEPGTMWCIPNDWRDSEDVDLRNVTPKQETISIVAPSVLNKGRRHGKADGESGNIVSTIEESNSSKTKTRRNGRNSDERQQELTLISKKEHD
ncbi:hypothetical protein [Azospirillum doebereinerae]|uniref:VapC45 PIN like domain-containing protein n=1 Tax=Azospirillum doebereinerae TaxID=92933 RepID=A0A3S0XJF0_9PROT|nr:hypothetical protein [Azospirillum doebereinerae]RUQ65162.1 hypothetical protein EJ913_25800 [Azospirillum doebereinerae]